MGANAFDAELTSRISRAESFSEALTTLSDIVSRLGFTQTFYGYIPALPRQHDGSWAPLKPNTRGFPEKWEIGWTDFMTVDPYYHACFAGTEPVEWTEVQQNENLTKQQRRAIEYLNDFGLSRGFNVPVHLPYGRFAVMGAIVDNSVEDWSTLRASARDPLFRIMHSFTRTLFRRGLETQIEVASKIMLTKREQECLIWSARGKTCNEIAIILGRSPETIRQHIKNSIAKLGASNRVEAVATALQRGLL